MIRQFRTRAALCFGVVAVSLIAASVASGDLFHWEKSPHKNTFTTTVDPVFTTTAGKIECAEGFFNDEGSSENEGEYETEPPEMSECTVIGVPGTVDYNGCFFTFHIGAGTTGTVDIQCPPGKEITFTSTKCILHFAPQGPLSTVTYSNIGTGATREVITKLALSNVSYKHTEGTGVGKCTTGAGNTGGITWTIVDTSEDPSLHTHIGHWVQ